MSLLSPPRHPIIKDSALRLRLDELPSEPTFYSKYWTYGASLHFLGSEPGRRPKEMLKMQDDPDELLKTKGKFRTRNTDPDACLKIKELRQYLLLADKFLKGRMVIARISVKSLPGSLIPARNRRNSCQLRGLSPSSGSGVMGRTNRADRQCVSLRWHGHLGHDFTRAGCPCHFKLRHHRSRGVLSATERTLLCYAAVTDPVLTVDDLIVLWVLGTSQHSGVLKR